MELNMVVVDAVPLMDKVISIFKPLADEKGIILNWKEIKSEPCYVEADPLRFKQVLLNLVSNAIKYNHPNGSVVVSIERLSSGRVRIGIKDTGRGISEDRHEKLFTPFERLNEEEDEIEGTGIGLAITKKLTEMMNGSIGFECNSGKGSFFYVDFPAAKNPPLSIQATNSLDEATLIPSTSSSPNGKRNYRILYVEDTPANLDLVRKILALQPNLEMISAVNACEGIELARNELPDLILLDINLPDMDGFTVFQHLKEMEKVKTIPVVALTADAMEADIKKGLKMGFKDFITKPIQIDAFLEVVTTILNGKKP
jgi:CheY-like chemotaxis protein